MPVSLLPKKTFEESALWEKLLQWSLGIGRVVIIGTEIVVLSVFFARFFLDRKITNLSEEVKTKQTIIATTGDLESRFRILQDRLTAIKNLKTDQNQYSKALDSLTQRIPPTTTFTNLSLGEGKVNLSAKTPSGEEFAHLLVQLFTWEDLSQVTLKSANYSPKEGVFNFSLDLKINPGAYQSRLSRSEADHLVQSP